MQASVNNGFLLTALVPKGQPQEFLIVLALKKDFQVYVKLPEMNSRN